MLDIDRVMLMVLRGWKLKKCTQHLVFLLSGSFLINSIATQ